MNFKSLELGLPKAGSVPDLSLSLTDTFFPKLKPGGLGFSATSSRCVLIDRMCLFEGWGSSS